MNVVDDKYLVVIIKKIISLKINLVGIQIRYNINIVWSAIFFILGYLKCLIDIYN